jgi:hypothetical protein
VSSMKNLIIWDFDGVIASTAEVKSAINGV